ncbi:GTPase-activating Rap/Ran-GAP domain-like protein 3 isoform X4 [Daphnia pulicaria]|uniref:GTPase-activating Rap/Ran-GAP domain-like protein 3 isoform X4 n=1 Tax=Daphnia pulicaria TaxID=35523 RepID=UPI001EE9ECFE|nr:GTPase-activating Rap/Ran-GAP domain-like protein 3 isoform X4 [Daphnia pulicaria]
MSNFSSASPLLLFKSKSFRRHRDTSGSPTRTLGLPDGVEDGGVAGASGGGPDSSLSSGNNSPHRLRRVFTTHACRRRPTEAKSLGGPPGHASPIQFRRMTSLMKKPLGIAHSVPLGVPSLCGPLNFNSSSSSDLVSRRGAFSRRHYGSVELLPQTETESGGDAMKCRRFRLENGEGVGDRDEVYNSPTTPVLENPEYQTRWYFKYFLGKLHQIYVGTDSEKQPFFISVVLTDSNNQGAPQYKAILWKKTGAQKIYLPHTPGRPLNVKQILSNFQNMDRLEKSPKEVVSPELQKSLLLLEEQEGSVNFKFGVLYAKAGQGSDDEMFSNERGSKEFERFLTILGNKIRLKGWDKYRGGLDVKGDMTGAYSVHTIYEGHEIMFHVSTLLPYSKDNKQQLERKRHIGNDIVNIVFLDGTPEEMAAFSPNCIKSQFTHIFALVTYLPGEDAYRFHIYSEESVPLFGPSLPSPPIFPKVPDFREFLLVKLINGEKAAFNTPIFSQKRERTLDMLIRDMYAEVMTEHRGSLQRRALSEVLPEGGRSSRRREEARQVEFVRVGQALKLDTIVKGDAPTSLANTGLFRRSPWEPQCFYPDFHYEIICGDSWSDNRLILATESGVFVVEEGGTCRMIFDKSVQIKQLTVVEAHGILLVRTDRGRDSRMHVFRLSSFESDACGSEPAAFSRQHMKEQRLERTKGTHLYAVSRLGGSHLRMAVAVGKKILLLQWRHSAAWTAWCPTSDTDTVEGFQYLREFQVSESPLVLTLIDSGNCYSAGGQGENQICVGYRHQFDLINERTSETKRFYNVEGKWAHLVAAIDVYEDEEPELLLCFNNTCHFQKLDETNASSEHDFHWNSVPESIVCAFPYILAFTADSIEVRLVINGNLIQAMVMPRLSLITSKSDVFFATTAPEFFSLRGTRMDHKDSSPPSSPHSSPDGKPFRLYRIQLNNLGAGTAGNCAATPVSTTPIPARNLNRRYLMDDVSASPPPASRGGMSRMARLNSRKDLRIRLEQQGGGGGPGSNPGSPGTSSNSSRGGAGSGTGFSRSCTASPTPGTTSPNAPSSPRSSSSGSPKTRPTQVNTGLGSRKLSLMAEELEVFLIVPG